MKNRIWQLIAALLVGFLAPYLFGRAITINLHFTHEFKLSPKNKPIAGTESNRATPR